MRSSGSWVIAIALLLLLPLYLVSYALLVIPQGIEFTSQAPGTRPSVRVTHYRFGDRQAARLYWPLEKMDRRVRPVAWEAAIDGWTDVGGPGSISAFSTNCMLGAEEMTTEASFFEDPEENVDFASDPFADAPAVSAETK